MLIIEKVENPKILFLPCKISDSSDQGRAPNKIQMQYKDVVRKADDTRRVLKKISQ